MYDKEENEKQERQFLDEYLQNQQGQQTFITIPLRFRSQTSISKENESKDQQNRIFPKEIYSIVILFAKSSNYEDLDPVFLPFFTIDGDSDSQSYKQDYQFCLNIKVKNPWPCVIETGILFSDPSGKRYIGKASSIKLHFEDMFLPVEITKELL